MFQWNEVCEWVEEENVWEDLEGGWGRPASKYLSIWFIPSQYIPTSYSSYLHHLLITCSFPHHLFITCSFPFHHIFITYSSLAHHLFIISPFPAHFHFIPFSSLVHFLVITTSSPAHFLFVTFLSYLHFLLILWRLLWNPWSIIFNLLAGRPHPIPLIHFFFKLLKKPHFTETLFCSSVALYASRTWCNANLGGSSLLRQLST